MTTPATGLDRNDRIEALVDRIIATGPAIRDETARTPRSDALFDLESVLTSGIEDAFAQLSGQRLDRLRRKIEVARKLYAGYDGKLSTPVKDALLSAAGVNRLCAVMLLAALRSGDTRFLNSALKLIDGLVLPATVSVLPELVLIAEETLDVLVPWGQGQP
jgi:hypothetical protein